MPLVCTELVVTSTTLGFTFSAICAMVSASPLAAVVLALVLPSLCTALYTTGPDVLRISAAPSTPPPTPASAHTSTSAMAASVFLVPGRFFFGCWSDGSGPPIEGAGDGCVYCGCA